MKKDLFQFELPDELIAQTPLARRTDSRLLHLGRACGDFNDHHFHDLPSLLRKNDLLVFNDTRVIPARLFGAKQTGGKVEILIERIQNDQQCLAQIRSSKSPKPHTQILLDDATALLVEGREGAFFKLRALDETLPQILERLGHMPLPPYIRRDDSNLDQERYQTVYASRLGAVAAPTAGLHFDQALLTALEEQCIRKARVTLHVGAGTFQPVREENIEDHQMHAEYLEVSESVCDAVAQTKAMGGRVIAVGTTSVRSLETAAANGELSPYKGDSRIFIYPGYDFKVVDGMITNFHLPESTLLMLVSAFAGLDSIKAAYQHAITSRYRFFSYGDAMLIL